MDACIGNLGRGMRAQCVELRAQNASFLAGIKDLKVDMDAHIKIFQVDLNAKLDEQHNGMELL